MLQEWVQLCGYSFYQVKGEGEPLRSFKWERQGEKWVLDGAGKGPRKETGNEAGGGCQGILTPLVRGRAGGS